MMKRLLTFLTALAFIPCALADYCGIIPAGATSQSVYIRILDATTGVPSASYAFNSSGIDLEYLRAGAAATAITEATQTASGAYSSGGFVSVGKGNYRLDIPDAAIASGVPRVSVQGVVTGGIVVACNIDLTPSVNVSSWNGTATATTNPLPNAVAGASGGLLISGSNSGTTTLGALTVTGTATISDGLVVSRSTSNTAAATFTGNGTGNGVTITSGSGATGTGLAVVSAATNGTAATFAGVGTGNGITSTGGATGHGVSAVGGSTSGSGLRAVATTSGNGILATGVGTTQAGIAATGGSTSSAGMSLAGGGTGAGLLATGGATGVGGQFTGGATSGAGAQFTGTAGNSTAVNLVGQGSAAGLTATGGATGHGISAVGGATSGDGLRATATTSGKGLNAIGIGTTQPGILATGGSTSSAGISALGGGTGAGILATSGSGATGDGITAVAASTNGNGVGLTATGSGVTMTMTPSNIIQAAGTAWGSGAITAASIASGAITEAKYDTTAGSFKPLGILDQGTAQAATGTTIQLRSAATFADSTLVGSTVMACGSTQGYCQSATISAYTGSTDTATVSTWPVTPSGTITYYVFGTAAASGGGSAPSAATVAAAVWDESLSGHTTSGTAGERLGRVPNAAAGSNGGLPTVDANNSVKLQSGTGANQISLSSGAVLLQATQTGVTIPTVTTVTNAPSDSSGTTTLLSRLSATRAGYLDNLSAGTIPTAAQNAAATWDLSTTGHTTGGTFGAAMVAAGSAGDPWATSLPGSYTAGSAGYILGNNLNASISSRMATFTLPTNFSSLSIDGSGRTLLQPTQTGVTIPTVTTLTNAPSDSSGTTTLLSRVSATRAGYLDNLSAGAVATASSISALNNLSSAQAQTAAAAALAAYDPPTKAEQDAGFASLLTSQQIIVGTCDSGSATTCVDDALTQAAAAQLQDRLICFDDNWCGLITTFSPSTDTVTTTKVAPSTRAGKAYTIFPSTLQ